MGWEFLMSSFHLLAQTEVLYRKKSLSQGLGSFSRYLLRICVFSLRQVWFLRVSLGSFFLGEETACILPIT